MFYKSCTAHFCIANCIKYTNVRTGRILVVIARRRIWSGDLLAVENFQADDDGQGQHFHGGQMMTEAFTSGGMAL